MMKDILTHLGIFPHSEQRPNTYCSPFTREVTPSFFIDGSLWNDFSSGHGGNWKKFIAMYSKHIGTFIDVSNITGEIKESNQNDSTQSRYIPNQNGDMPKKEKVKTIELMRIVPVEKRYLFEYAESRGIPRELTSLIFKEIIMHHNPSNRTFFSLGIKNDSGGIAHRNAKSKGNIGKTDVTTIKGSKSDSVVVLEGMFSYASYCELNKRVCFPHDIKLLNSLTNVKKAGLYQYREVKLYLDNDTSGDIATIEIMNSFPYAIDQRGKYRQYSDPNDLLTKTLITEAKYRVRKIIDEYTVTLQGAEKFKSKDLAVVKKWLGKNKIKKEK